jgi:L-ascorbate metabolism protein UlaG (beta-lactamase superfamily)
MKAVHNSGLRFLLFGFITGLILVSSSRADELVSDFNGDGIVNLTDLSILAQYWLQNESSVDIAPAPLGDHMIDYKDLAVLTEHWLETEIVYIQWLGHASVKIWTEDIVIYIDPRNLSESLHDATLVCVTHSHSDHYQPADIAKVSNPDTQFIAPADVVALYGSGQVILPGQTIQFEGFSVTAVPAYNINKPNHPKSNNWVGFIIELASKRIYVAGDTDLIEEMKTLGSIDVAFLPAGGAYTMNAQEAAEAACYINPTLAIPYHWGEIVGTIIDAETFAELACCNVKIMSPGEIISSDDWLKDFSLVAHWKLDETEGDIAYDSSGGSNATVHGAIWTEGKIDGALKFDGLNDYVDCNDSEQLGPEQMTLSMWLKPEHMGGMRYIASRAKKDSDDIDYVIMRHLEGEVEFSIGQLGSDPVSVISQANTPLGEWSHVAVCLNGSQASIYINGQRDSSANYSERVPRESYWLVISSLRANTRFYNGLIDDVRIYDQALSDEEIEALAR